MLRDVGRFSSASLLRFVLMPVVFTSTTGDSPVTISVSLIVPMAILTSMVAMNPAPNRISVRRTDWNPANSNVRAYSPRGSAVKR